MATKRIKWKHGDIGISGGLWSHITPDTKAERRIFLERRDALRIFNLNDGKEIAYSKDWCKLDADEIAWRFEYKKIGNVLKKDENEDARMDESRVLAETLMR